MALLRASYWAIKGVNPNMIVVSGRLPRLVATETEAMQGIKIRADKEVFEFW